jgi:2-dehydropantoate 2-reductase
MQNRKIAVMGAGAVGCYFGGMLARAGLPVTLVARPPHREAIARDGLTIDSFRFPTPERVRVDTASSAEGVREASMVLFCVKTVDTEVAAREMQPYLAPGAALVSMQNGVDNVERMRAACGIDALAAAVYVAAEMSAPGVVRHSGRGDLVVGRFPGSRAETAEVEACFARAGIACQVVDDIRAPLWTKMFMNCGCNAISALARARYGKMAADEEIREVIRMLVEEAEAVARAEAVPLPEQNFVEAAWRLVSNMTGAFSSTAQDIFRGKKTEIDSLNGYIARRGAARGIPAPVNRTLWALVKLLEESSAAGAAAGEGRGNAAL